MRLRTKLSVQSTAIIIVTLLITVISAGLFARIVTGFSLLPFGSTQSNAMHIALHGSTVIYSSSGLSEAQLKGVIMDCEGGKASTTVNGKRFLCSSEQLPLHADDEITLITITPHLDLSGYYKSCLIFICLVSLISFIAATYIVSLINMRDIVTPIIRLKDTADRIAGGELDTVVESCGEGELYELSDSMERLRIRLKETVYYREKYDNNRKFLISGISHDLRTPVTSAKGYIEGVIDGVAATPEKQTVYLKNAVSALDTINNMIDDLLLYSKLDLNKIPFEVKKIPLTEYIGEIAAFSSQTFERSGKTLVFCGGISEDICVMLDPKRFLRVIQNILGNAEKNIAPGSGLTEIFLRESEGSVIIEIRDNGNGIKKEELPNIFNKFYRGDASRQTDGSSGLGLTIAKHLVEGQGGRIWALSEEGKGTSILISLKKA